MEHTLSLVNPHLNGEPFYWESRPDAPRLLMLHGFTATPAEVRLAGEYLHRQGYTVAAPLLPGHGTTPQDLNLCRWQDWVQAVEACYQDLARANSPVAVLGESMGGLLALHLAAAHPEITAAVLYAPALITRTRWIMWLSPLVSQFRAFQPKRPGRPSAADARWQGYGVYPTRAAYELFKLQNATHRLLESIQQPLLIVQGRLDTAVHPSTPSKIASRVKSPVVHIHWMAKSGHCVILDEEWETAAALAHKFIQSYP